MYYQNCRGLRTKTHNFYKNICIHNYDVIVLVETWLNSSVFSEELFDDRYDVHRRDRESSGFVPQDEGGGVLLAVLRKYRSKRMKSWESMCEDIWITIDSLQLTLCAVYLPPPVTRTPLDLFLAGCNSVCDRMSLDSNVCILGDFNLGIINWNSLNDNSFKILPYTCQALLDFISTNKLHQFNNVTNTGRILDLVLSTLQSCTVTHAIDILTKTERIHPPLHITLSLSTEVISLP